MSSPCFVAIGDSFTARVEPPAPPFADLVAALLEPPAPPFADLVAALLPDWRYANLAEPGARCGEVRAGQLGPALALRPELVSVICGANDVVRTTRPQIEDFADDFDEILLRLRSALPAASIVTATYPAVGEFLPLRPRTRARVTSGLNEVNTIVRRSSARHGAVCLELADHPGRGDRSNYAADGFHPSAAGHRKAALVFTACLRDQLGIRLDPEEAAA